jgi:hypothetical protein
LFLLHPLIERNSNVSPEVGLSLHLLANASFGSLQRVQFEVIFLNFLLDVCGKIAGPFCPLGRGLAIGLAIRTGLKFRHAIAPFAGLYDGITSPTVIGTAVLLHEDTFCSCLDGLTNHGYLPPFFLDLF